MTTSTKKRRTPPIEAERAYTPQQVADLKNISYGFVMQAIHSTGEPHPKTGVTTPPLQAVRVGKGYRINASWIEDWWRRMGEA